MQLRLASGGEVHALLRAGGHRARILLLHGNPGSLADWSPLLPALGELADIAAICWPRAIQSAWRALVCSPHSATRPTPATVCWRCRGRRRWLAGEPRYYDDPRWSPSLGRYCGR